MPARAPAKNIELAARSSMLKFALSVALCGPERAQGLIDVELQAA
jgi:hypothetical protein